MRSVPGFSQLLGCVAGKANSRVFMTRRVGVGRSREGEWGTFHSGRRIMKEGGVLGMAESWRVFGWGWEGLSAVKNDGKSREA